MTFHIGWSEANGPFHLGWLPPVADDKPALGNLGGGYWVDRWLEYRAAREAPARKQKRLTRKLIEKVKTAPALDRQAVLEVRKEAISEFEGSNELESTLAAIQEIRDMLELLGIALEFDALLALNDEEEAILTIMMVM